MEVRAPVRGGTRPRAARGARACGKKCACLCGARARDGEREEVRARVARWARRWRGGRAGKELCSGVQVSSQVEACKKPASEGRQVCLRACKRACGVSGSLGRGEGARGEDLRLWTARGGPEERSEGAGRELWQLEMSG